MEHKTENKKNTKDHSLSHLDMQTADAVSSNDFTGLIPANPREKDRKEYKSILNSRTDAAED